MSRITDFYLNNGTDDNGRTLDFILAQNDIWWEGCHDHIQWVFPTVRPSMMNHKAPVLTLLDVEYFRGSLTLRCNLARSYHRFLSFLGLEYDECNDYVHTGDNFITILKSVWLTPNHNYLRITRVLECLNTCGLEVEAQEFYDFLKMMGNMFDKYIPVETIDFWYKASLLGVK